MPKGKTSLSNIETKLAEKRVDLAEVRHMGKNRKRYSRKYYKSAELPPCDYLESDSELQAEEVIKKIYSTKFNLKSSAYISETFTAFKKVQELHPHLQKIDTIVCFGLGHFGWCATSRNQLGFISLIKEYLEIQEVLFQDPVFTPKEAEILKNLGFSVIPGNLEGKFGIDQEKKYLIYLPHCPKQLTNNFLWKNWGTKLSNILLLSNSFSSVLISGSKSNLQIDAGLILKAEEFTEEIPLENNFIYTDVFNDTSIHVFPRDKLEVVPEVLWSERGPEPDA
uniref:SRR1-like domain-containing protein n=1 Tax=Lutzomyia longipalpis TaxID=7200 RepID=A0A1B0CCU9_LUTLO